MGWLGWTALVAALVVVFFVLDRLVCGGRYCRRFVDFL
jgi:hypothetical protein